MERLKHRFWLVLPTLILLAVAVGYYWYFQTGSEQQQAVRWISLTVQLPDEAPTVATVSDISKLSSQPLFRHAQNGDLVFFYEQADRAILYRPSLRKIIDMGPFTIAPSS